MSGSLVAVQAGASTWQIIALGALCGQLTFRLAWCREHSAVTATERLQSLAIASGLAVQSKHHLRTVQTTAEGTSFREA